MKRKKEYVEKCSVNFCALRVTELNREDPKHHYWFDDLSNTENKVNIYRERIKNERMGRMAGT